MIAKRLVLIVGAGANFEFGMPLGSDLNQLVIQALSHASSLDGMSDEARALTAILGALFPDDWPKYWEAAQALAHPASQFASIDEALHFGSRDPLAIKTAKLAIAQAILTRERSVVSAVDASLTSRLSPDRYLTHILSLAISGARRDQYLDFFKNLVVVDFNYDRVIEHHLYTALQFHYRLTDTEARNSLRGLQVIKPYGSLGDLPWKGTGGPVGFGDSPSSSAAVSSAAARIRTFTEGAVDNKLSDSIATALAGCAAVVFLGFGYHLQNLELLQSKLFNDSPNYSRIFATLKGIDDNNDETILSLIRQRLVVAPSVRPVALPRTASALLKDLRPSIAAAVA